MRTKANVAISGFKNSLINICSVKAGIKYKSCHIIKRLHNIYIKKNKVLLRSKFEVFNVPLRSVLKENEEGP